jgi:anti-sigma factor RsiW
MQCKNAHPLVPKYLDEELSEAEAAPLRRHLLECSACRVRVQEARSLRAWFVPSPPVAVPRGFAARVARRAFAGDPGEVAPVRAEAPAEGGRVYQFTLQLTAAAAVLLATLSIALTIDKRPKVERLQADGTSLSRTLDELDALNRAEEATRADDPVEDAGEARGAAERDQDR